MKAVINKLEKQHQAASQFLDLHKEIIAPVQDLPNEILSQIFLSSLDNDGCFRIGENSHRYGACVPWNLIAVCRRWRQVGTGLPQMWSGVSLQVTRSPNHPPCLDWSVVRSNGAPLTMKLDLDYESNLQQLALRGLAHRVVSLQVCGPFHHLLDGPGVESFSFPHLQNLSITVLLPHYSEVQSDDESEPARQLTLDWNNVVSLFGKCPSLRGLELVVGESMTYRTVSEFDTIRLNPASVAIDLGLLERLKIDTGTVHLLADIITHCNSLTFLHITTADRRQPSSGVLIDLPQLHTLCALNVPFLFAGLQCPALRHATVGKANAEALSTMILQSGCVLETLSLAVDMGDSEYTWQGDPSSWGTLYSCLGSLRSLVLEYPFFGVDVPLASIAPSCAFPVLKSLTVRMRGPAKWLETTGSHAIEEFLNAYAYRLDGAPLDRIEVVFDATHSSHCALSFELRRAISKDQSHPITHFLANIWRFRSNGVNVYASQLNRRQYGMQSVPFCLVVSNSESTDYDSLVYTNLLDVYTSK